MTIYTIVVEVDSYHFSVSGTNRDRLWEEALGVMEFLTSGITWQESHRLTFKLQSYELAPIWGDPRYST